MSKYHNIKTVVDNITFDSKKEAARYQELKLMQKAGAISELEMQPQYRLYVNDVLICRYVGDFKYIDHAASRQIKDIVRVVEDAKGVKTPAYRLKKKLMKAVYGIEIQEV